MFDLTGKVAFVSGAGSVGPRGGTVWGNGKASAVLLARRGAKIFATDIDPGAVAETAAIIAGEGGICVTHEGDATQTGQVKAAVDACLARFGRIDILLNNVGGSAPGGAAEMTEEVWHRQMRMNLDTVFFGCHHVIPVMLGQGGGVIVNLSSVAGLRHIGRDHVAYSAAKAGIIQFTRATAITYARQGIRANTVVPGLMHTPLVEARLAGQVADGDAERLIAARNAQVPMGRMGDAWDVAHAVLYLASDEARYVTGTEIVVDGGLVAAAR